MKANTTRSLFVAAIVAAGLSIGIYQSLIGSEIEPTDMPETSAMDSGIDLVTVAELLDRIEVLEEVVARMQVYEAEKVEVEMDLFEKIDFAVDRPLLNFSPYKQWYVRTTKERESYESALADLERLL